ncbi:hypothetical protein NUW58_g4456 [Xylaria curta]|uniref:Uncharacterized protein n=1 Tax=Xylaria curta TaxID=42375 RepID=A0ACC1P7L9_9PEZI|nr:hypothetical protein NUW58_g4456 [Xylaria curta]
MTMTLDNQSRLGALNFGHMSSYSNSPHFTNPWGSGSASQHSHHGMYSQGGMNANLGGLDSMAKHHPSSRASTNTSVSMAPYGSIPVTSSAGSTHMADVFEQQGLLNMPQDLLSLNRMQTTSAAYGEPSYATATPSPVHATYSASPSSYDNVSGYAPAPMRSTFALAPEADSRRGIQPTDDRRSFADAIDAGQGMLAMSQETPRAIYPPNNRGRGSADSYGFPSTHSTNSSISSASNYGGGYYAASVDSVSDYSTAGSDIESVTSRTLPRPNLMTQPPPAPQSMMGQFSSKVSSSTQKKHKCKRFAARWKDADAISPSYLIYADIEKSTRSTPSLRPDRRITKMIILTDIAACCLVDPSWPMTKGQLGGRMPVRDTGSTLAKPRIDNDSQLETRQPALRRAALLAVESLWNSSGTAVE